MADKQTRIVNGIVVTFDPSRILTRVMRITLGLEAAPATAPAPLRKEAQDALALRERLKQGHSAQSSGMHMPVCKGQRARKLIRGF
jgi:hypothetical protein